LTKYALDGNIIKRTYLQAGSWISQVIIGKLDNNIYYGTGDNENEIYLYNKQLQLVDNWPNRGIHYTDFANIIFGRVSSENNKDIISFYNAADMYFGYGITFGYKINGESQSWFPLRTYGLNVGHVFSDINNDGSTEYIYHSIQNDMTWLKIMTIPGIPFTSENYPWPIFGHDRYMTNQYGFIPSDEPNSIEYISNKIPKVFELYQNYPNPFNATTIIKFDIKKQSDVKVIVYDILGRYITVLTDQNLLPGSYRLSWNSSGVSSGVYFYELVTESENKVINRKVRKAVIVK
jgi:hypothetical protein